MGSDNWYKVDNVAKVFLATVTKRDTRTLRVSCILKEEIDPALLQQAVLSAIQDRPQFQVRFRRGVFWHYMEDTDIRPVVRQESDRVCPLLYAPAKAMLHYQVTYFGKRINQEIKNMIEEQNIKDNINVLEYDIRQIAAFNGASIISSFGTFNENWISKEEYDECGFNYLLKNKLN